jgi:exopolysaccharide biosynthesis polyprenyl glycosylphosphotransferase
MSVSADRYPRLAPLIVPGDRTIEMLKWRGRTTRRRGWLVRRALVLADVVGVALAFWVTEFAYGPGTGVDNEFGARGEVLLFVASLPAWILLAKLYGLYDRDEERTDYSTADDVLRVFHLVTVSTWLLIAAAAVTRVAAPDWSKVFTFWMLAVVVIPLARIVARAAARCSPTYVQNTVIVGAGDVGQLVARKLLHHPEYGINLVGFVDPEPKERRGDLGDLPLLGPPERLREIVSSLEIERVIVAFSLESHGGMLALIRALREFDVQVDIVPRLFEIVGPRAALNSIEGLQLLSLPPARLTRSARLAKRAFDLVVATALLFATAPLFAYIAWRIRRDSPGPIFFRQIRLGMNLKEFELLKFRTMYQATGDDEHRAYVKATMDARALPQATGLYKLDRGDAVTKAGRWLRGTSLDELPQLLNVVRGDMSLVGPRPCLPYEIECFAAHHFERFFVPAGLTGLWQVKARAHSTFGEALDMDVVYAKSRSFALDLKLLCLTPLQVLRRKATA